MELITAIVPAYNEAKTIGRVIDVLRRSPLIHEVVVVSDGSTDTTAEIARQHGVHVLVLPVNLGKGFAVHYGVKHAKTPFVALFDADLRGLRERHVRRLVSPILRGRADMTVGITDRGPFVSSITAYLPLLSGQRVFRQSDFLTIPLSFLEGYRIEAALNYVCDLRGARVMTVFMQGLKLRRKYEKVGFVRSIGEYLSMTVDVITSMVAVRFAGRLGAFTALS